MKKICPILDRLDKAITELHHATLAALALAKSQAEDAERKQGDDIEWTRLPGTKAKCAVSGWGRSKIMKEAGKDEVRTKSVKGCRYYSLADVRALIVG